MLRVLSAVAVPCSSQGLAEADDSAIGWQPGGPWQKHRACTRWLLLLHCWLAGLILIDLIMPSSLLCYCVFGTIRFTGQPHTPCSICIHNTVSKVNCCAEAHLVAMQLLLRKQVTLGAPRPCGMAMA